MVQLIITGINVFILFFAIGYILSPMVSKMLSKRKTQIADSINEARVSKEDAEAFITADLYVLPLSCTYPRLPF